MAPKTPGKKGNLNKNATKSVAPEVMAAAAIDYEAVQLDEIEALQAIFMEDYEEMKVESAWSRTSDRRFKLRISAFSDPDSAIDLSVRLTATYPKTLPLLEVSGLEHFHERTQKRIRNVLDKRPKQLLGEVMIHAIATEIQEILEDAVQARQQGTLPSLEDERASAEEVAITLAKQAEDAELRRQRAAQEEEQRTLDQMVEEELSRRDKRKASRPVVPTFDRAKSYHEEILQFDQPGQIHHGKEELTFSSVVLVSKDRATFVAKPLVNTASNAPLVAVRQYDYKSKDREDLVQLENVLEQVRKLRHSNIAPVYAFRIERVKETLSVTLCIELVTRGSLRDLLSLTGAVQLERARQWCVELLEALEECHRHGIVHGSISDKAILLQDTTPTSVKLTDIGYGALLQPQNQLPSRWQPSENNHKESKTSTKKADIWSLGVVILQMCLGQGVTSYSSPQSAIDKMDLSDSFEDLIERMCNTDSKKRPSAFDLLASEFLRTSAPILDEDSLRARPLASGLRSPHARRSRHNSSNAMEPASRYAQDFTEIGRLGKGGFGEVVKARNKLDGGIYAIKKISRAPQLDQILSEVMLLNRLNHPYVVRYFSTWVEETIQANGDETVSTTDDTLSGGPAIEFGYQSTGGLDFVSSSGYPQIEFGVDSEEEESADDDDDLQVANDDSAASSEVDDGRLRLKRSRSTTHKVQSTLYIQMEYCERRTMRDLVRKGVSEDDCWRYIRQITEGLAHVHSHSIIHRDLKPDNIFIDVAGNPKIGDFGLATTNQFQTTDRSKTFSGQTSVDMTMSVGTALYVAPEISSGTGSSYNEKVDMYSLGIIFFEMCEPFATAMERINALQQIRKKDNSLPSVFHATGGKAAQGRVISCLISHKPGDRPSSTELLRTGLLPVKIEDETIRQALSSLSDSRSPNHQKMMSALFAHDQPAENRVKALAWDAKDQSKFEEPMKIRLRAIAKDALTFVFRLHGAEECQREGLLPRSTYYTTPNVFQVLDASGNLLQLPYDLTFPLARKLARDRLSLRCTYTFGHVYRDLFSGGPPTMNEEVDFDIVGESSDNDHAYDDAELLKVLDDVSTDSALMIKTDNISFHLNHASILDTILDHSRVPRAQFSAVKECLSKLGFRQFNWTKIRSELRSPALGLPTAIVDDLEQFDFRDTPDRATSKLKDLLHGTGTSQDVKIESAINHLQDVLKHIGNLGFTRKIWIAPLSCFNAKFYSSGILFQMVHDRKTSRDVLAAGGRYDQLIQQCRASGTAQPIQSAVGASIGLDRLVGNMLKSVKSGHKAGFMKDTMSHESPAKRCDVLMSVGGGEAVRDAGLKLLSVLWSHHISAEFASDKQALTDEQQYAFVVTLRHEASTTVKVCGTTDDAVDSDVPIVSLVSHLQQELRELQGIKRKQQVPARHTSQTTIERKSNVQVLMSQHRSKKSNKYHIVEAAQQRWAQQLEQWKDAPILAIETRDDVVDLIRDTRLGDADSWRKALHAVPLNERQYLQQVQELLTSWRTQYLEGNQMREACLFNFRTGHGIYYDLGL
ncbi:hypothetical protein AMS68_004044 [Peltaster fructicola]|uniref:non-specific serine/threonine protein kinase n=1 Tax=Peltaster fructicola TaxID=286661 RepID=A0A6H0XUU0_9PEZI|nr:hypothetical protein AMS68_004044 [Peltaster fructicola]